MAITIRPQDTFPDTRDRELSNMFSNLSRRFYPVNIIGSTLYDVFSMYGTEFASASAGITQVFNDLNIETARVTAISGSVYPKLYDNFGVMLGISKSPYQEYNQFNTGSVWNSYRTQLKFLNLAYLEGSTYDALARIGQAVDGISPVILENIQSYPGWVLTSYSASVSSILAHSVGVRPYYLLVSSRMGRYGNIIPVFSTASVSVGSQISVSYSVLGLNTILQDEYFSKSGVILWFFHAGGPAAQTGSIRSLISNAVASVLPAYIKYEILYSNDFVSWRPTAPVNYVDTYASGSTTFAVSPLGWIYNDIPTSLTGSVYMTDVLTLP